jgi:hypothetical protein
MSLSAIVVCLTFGALVVMARNDDCGPNDPAFLPSLLLYTAFWIGYVILLVSSLCWIATLISPPE